jgi:putative FmdB family regulatory protein
MPIYEYSCHRCGRRFEVRQKFADEPLKVHEECGGEAERLISAPMLHFKGTGWYVTDYAKSGTSPSTSGSNGHADSKGETKGEHKGEHKGETKGETKGESKAETKTESKTEAKTGSKPAPARA